jgi:hypothetical protein
MTATDRGAVERAEARILEVVNYGQRFIHETVEEHQRRMRVIEDVVRRFRALVAANTNGRTVRLYCAHCTVIATWFETAYCGLRSGTIWTQVSNSAQLGKLIVLSSIVDKTEEYTKRYLPEV